MDVASFLGRYPPFDELPPERLHDLEGAVRTERFAAGADVLTEDGAPSRFLYVIRQGALEVRHDGRVLDLLGEGELVGELSLITQEPPTATVRAHEDTLCYLIPRLAALEVIGSSAGVTTVLGRLRRRIQNLVAAEPHEPPDGRYRPVGEFVRRPVVTIDAGATVAEAAERMSAERVSSLLVPMRDGWGILTDRDLRTRVVARRAPPETPVRDVASFPVSTLPADALAGEALLAMFDEGIHHFPIVDRDGTMVGVVTDTDLMGIGRHTPFAIRSAIERAGAREGVVEAGRDLPEVVCGLVESSADPVDVGRVVALVIDAMTRRLLTLGIGKLGDPPAAWGWLALGSAARREQALRTDQDHALAYEPHDAAVDEIDPYFAELSTFVTDGLAEAGIDRCAGNVMASHPEMRRTVEGWSKALRSWMDDLGTHGSELSSIVYDYRHVAGPLDPEPSLDAEVRGARDHPAFIRHLARRAVNLRPPTGFFRNLVVEDKGEHAGRLDVKHRGIVPIGNLARVYAVRAGAVRAKDTRSRLAAAADAGVVERGTSDELTESFRFLWEIRLRHQVGQVRAGEVPDDFVDPSTLGPVARRGLREAFLVIGRAQKGLAGDVGIAGVRLR